MAKRQSFFKPRKIIDPHTNQERIMSPEEQVEMLKRGVLFNIPSQEMKKEERNDHSSQQNG